MNEAAIIRTGETCVFCGVEIVWLERICQYQHVPPSGQHYGYFKCRDGAANKRHWARPKRWTWWRMRWDPPPEASGT